MALLFFLVFTLIFTLFENVFLAVIVFLLIGVSFYTYQLFSKKKILSKKIILSIVGWFILAGLAFWIKEYIYYGGFDTWLSSENSWWKTIIWTWVISDISNQWKYIFTYKNDDYLLYSKKEYAIGNQIRIVWNLQINNKDIWSSYRIISPWIFNIPIFSWSFDFNKWMKMKWRRWTIYEDNSITNDQSQITNWMNVWLVKQMKRGLQERIIQTYGENRISGLILGMLIGDRSKIPATEYQSFINSGLVHIVAVSGWNILMIVVFLQCILFFLPFYVRLGLILITIIWYGLICGLDSSVFRAVLMWGINMLALFRWREINVRRLLSISCIIMLIINPYFLAYDTGFLLSYSAIIGIVYFETSKNDEVEISKNENKNKNWLQKTFQYVYKSYISPSIWASIWIFPIMIFFMGRINMLGIVGNLLVLPLVPFVMIYGFVSVWLHLCLRWEWLLWIEIFLVQYIYKISDLLSQYGMYLMVAWLRFKYLIFLIFLVLFVFWRLKDRSKEQGARNKVKEKRS